MGGVSDLVLFVLVVDIFGGMGKSVIVSVLGFRLASASR